MNFIDLNKVVFLTKSDFRDFGFGINYSFVRKVDNRSAASGFHSISEAMGWASKYGYKVVATPKKQKYVG